MAGAWRNRERFSTISAGLSITARRSECALGVELSLDGKRYHRVEGGVLGGRGTQESLRSFLPQSARYVKFAFRAGPKDGVPVVQEIAVHGAAVIEEVSAK